MQKIIKNPETILYPLPAILVSMGKDNEQKNIITISWTGILNSAPPICYISVRPERFSYNLLKQNKEFVINLSTRDLLYAVDFCGTKSGRDLDKFKELNLTPGKAELINAPLILESPVNIECRVKEIIPLGSHHMFMADIVSVNVNEELIDKKSGNIMADQAELISYSFKHYFQQGINLGKYGKIMKK